MSAEMKTVICPFCFVTLGELGGVCKRCGRNIIPSEWAVPRYTDDKSDNLYSPVGTGGLRKSLDRDNQYLLPSLEADLKGCCKTEVDLEIKRQEGLRIGSDSSCGMVIEGCDTPVLSVIVDRNRGEGHPDWWIYDCGGKAGTFVNRKRVLRVRELVHEDRVEVAGVPFRFEAHEDKGSATLVRLPIDGGGSTRAVIRVEHLTAAKTNGDLLLDDISFDVKEGEFVAIMGPSGCGKSSLIQRIAGLAPKDSGDIVVSDDFVYLPQDVERTLHPSMNLDREIESYRRIYRLSESDVEFEKRKADVLKQLGLFGKVKGKEAIGHFSGGEKRRVGLALALLRDPKILLLDEPFAGLDPENERKLTDELFKLAKNDGRTIVCITHGLANKEVFDRLLILGNDKKKRAYGSAWELLNLEELLTQEKRADGTCDQNSVEPASKHGGNLTAELRRSCKTRWKKLMTLCKAFRDDLKLYRKTLPGLELDAILLWLKGESRVLSGYLLQYWNENARGKSWLRSNLVVCCFVQPLIIVLGVRVACAYNFVEGNIESLTFCMALSLFWLGIINCSRELVRNRVPGRCLEKLGGVATPTYLLSKFLWVIGFCLAQTLTFTVMMWACARMPLDLSRWQETGMYWKAYDTQTIDANFWVVFPMSVASLMGGLCGLAVSAIFKTELKATALATNLAIMALLFSDRMVNITDICIKWVVPVVKRMPCYWPSQWMVHVMDPNKSNWADLGPNCLLLLAYLAVALIVVGFFEWKNERGWQGRDAE